MLHIIATCKYYFARLDLTVRNLARLHGFTNIPSLYFIHYLQCFQTSHTALPKRVWMKNDHLDDHPDEYEAQPSSIETNVSESDLLKSSAKGMLRLRLS